MIHDVNSVAMISAKPKLPFERARQARLVVGHSQLPLAAITRSTNAAAARAKVTFS
jgi:hypothetical protein